MPGVYFLQGGSFSVTGQATVTGQGVLIYNAPAAVADPSMAGTVEAAEVGPIKISASASVTLYAASADIRVSGQGQLTLHGDTGTSIGSRLIAFELKTSGKGAVAVDTSANNLDVLPLASAPTLLQLQAEHGFHEVGSLFENALGFGEKWFQDSLGKWIALLPSGFHFVGTFLENAEGFGEKWFQDQTGAWFALTAGGSLVRWDGHSFAGSMQNPAAVLDPLVYDDPMLLFDA
jgi:hypothetical protein